jgi:hypothetical protein
VSHERETKSASTWVSRLSKKWRGKQGIQLVIIKYQRADLNRRTTLTYNICSKRSIDAVLGSSEVPEICLSDQRCDSYDGHE